MIFQQNRRAFFMQTYKFQKSRRSYVSFAIGMGLTTAFTSAASAALLYDPVVTQVGDGVHVVSTAGATTTIQVYAPGVLNLAPIAQLAYGNGVLVNSGSSITEGELANNPGVADAATAGLPYGGAAYVFSGGYAANDGTAGVAGAGAGANRVVGDMTVTTSSVGSPTIVATQTSSTAYAPTGNIRAAVGNDSATNVWSAGTSSLGGTAGYRYFNNNTQVENSVGPTNTRTIQIRQGQLYGSSDTNGFVGISLIGSNVPQTAGQTVTPLFSTAPGSSSPSTVASPEAFALIDDPNNPSTPTVNGVNVPFNVAYIADSNAGNGNSQPGIQKWVYSPTTSAANNGWSLAYVITDSVTGAPDGYNGLAAELVQVPIIGAAGGLFRDDIFLFATNSMNVAGGGNSLEEFIDPLEGGSASATDATLIDLANAPADDEFRGVALAPVPEPTSAALIGVAMIGLLGRRRRAIGV
jgi:hypothetical protein